MRGRGKPKQAVAQTRIPGEVTAARERVETTWFSRTERDATLATLVTAVDNRREPFHRWAVFKQAFAPELVRRFLKGTAPHRAHGAPLLDPFSGTGTFVVECARRQIPAIGVDTLMSLAFVTQTKWSAHDHPPPDGEFRIQDSECKMADLEHPVHRAALICAVAARTTAKGTFNINAPPLSEAFSERLTAIIDDLRVIRGAPLRRNLTVRADARDLSFIADQSIGGIMTSPPYLSRHDYTRITHPFETAYNDFRPANSDCGTAENQLPASPRSRAGGASTDPIPPAAAEACGALILIGERKLADVVRDYFRDMGRVLRQFYRVLITDSPCWVVIGGARLKDVYIPTDTILADYAQSIGFTVKSIRVARTLVPGGRRFGRLTNIAPRESILVMSRSERRTSVRGSLPAG